MVTAARLAQLVLAQLVLAPVAQSKALVNARAPGLVAQSIEPTGDDAAIEPTDLPDDSAAVVPASLGPTLAVLTKAAKNLLENKEATFERRARQGKGKKKGPPALLSVKDSKKADRADAHDLDLLVAHEPGRWAAWTAPSKNVAGIPTSDRLFVVVVAVDTGSDGAMNSLSELGGVATAAGGLDDCGAAFLPKTTLPAGLRGAVFAARKLDMPGASVKAKAKAKAKSKQRDESAFALLERCAGEAAAAHLNLNIYRVNFDAEVEGSGDTFELPAGPMMAGWEAELFAKEKFKTRGGFFLPRGAKGRSGARRGEGSNQQTPRLGPCARYEQQLAARLHWPWHAAPHVLSERCCGAAQAPIARGLTAAPSASPP